MNVRTELNITGALKKFNNLLTATNTLPWLAASDIVRQSIQMNFDVEGRYGRERGGGGKQGWAQRKHDYPWPIMTKTAALRTSIKSEEIKDGVRIKSSGVHYASFLQDGTKKMVKRPFVVVQNTDIRNIVKEFDKHFQKAVMAPVTQNRI